MTGPAVGPREIGPRLTVVLVLLIITVAGFLCFAVTQANAPCTSVQTLNLPEGYSFKGSLPTCTNVTIH